MKKIFRLIAALAAATMAFSCMEEANPETPETGKTNYDGPMTTLEFTIDELETKTAWDGENHTWSEGDQIKLIWMDAEGKTGDVTAEVVDGKVTATVGVADTYYAVYPETTEYTLTAVEGETEPQFTVTIPKYQDGSFKQANLMAAKTAASEKVLAFKNLTHIFKFDLSEGCEYNFFRFCTNSTRNQDSRYAGTPSLITFSDNDVTVGGPATGAGNTSYVCIKLDEGATGPFYLGIRAGAVTDKGFGVLASKTRKEGDFTGGLLTTTAVETTRSKITNLGTLDNYISDNWYITSTGTGSGKSWSDPAGIGLLIDLMKNRTSAGKTYSGNGTTDIYRVIDARIHIAAGTYNIFEANGNANMNVAGLAYDATDRYKSSKITIIGGYPAEPSVGAVQDLSKEDNATVFTTNTDANSRIFRFDNQEIGHLNFEGITFTGSGETAVSSAGAGSYFSGTTTGVANYKNCKFTNFNNSNDGSQGGVILLYNASELTVNFENCTFADNVTASNGMIAIMAESTSVNMSSCKFSNNIAQKEGGAIYLTTGTVNLSNCEFSNNGAGVIPETSEQAPSTFTTNRGGAIFISGGEIRIDQCVFDGNYANIGADITAINHTPKVYINRSVFKNGKAYTNSSTDWRAKSIDAFYTEIELCLNNCLFVNNTSTYVTNNTGLPCIRTNGNNIAVVNTSFYDGSMRFINQSNATTSYTVNCLSKCETSKRGLTKWGTCKYNLTNSEVQTNDTDYGDLANLVMSWTNDTNMLTWTLAESITIAKHATVAEIASDLTTNFTNFDAWLKTVEEDPYGVDFYGNKRNPKKMNPGAWDPGL